MSIDVNVQNDLVIVTESSEDITVNVSNAAGVPGPAGVGVPVGGATGEVLKKFSNTNYDTYWAADASGLTSVGLSMPTAFAVSNTPLTSNGTIAVSGAGTAAQYIRGDGQLATFPSTSSGGSSVNYYLNGSVNASVAGYKQLANTATIGGGTDFTLVGNGLIAQFLTDSGNPNRLEIPGGAWNFEMYFQVSSSGGSQKFYVELLKYNGTTFTSIASSSTVPEEITGGTSIDLYLTSLAVPTTALLVTDRLAIRVYIVDNAGGRTVTLHTEDNTLCEIITTFAGGISALNGLTANTQYLATGTSGTDFAISSLSDTHTFNLPTASATNRGALSSADWSTFSGKVGGSGVTGQVAYWNGANSQTGSNNLFWDAANSRLGIGTNAPQTTLAIKFPVTGNKLIEFSNSLGVNYIESLDRTSGNAPLHLYAAQAGSYIAFTTGTVGGEKMRLHGTGNLSIGSPTTDGGQRLQVQGTTLLNGVVSIPGTIGGVIISPVNSGTGISINTPYNTTALDIISGANAIAVTITKTGYANIIQATGSSGTSTFNSNYAGFQYTGSYQHSGSAGLGQGIVLSVTNNTGASGNLSGAIISATANIAGATAIGLDVQAASTNGTSWSIFSRGANNYFQGDTAIGTTTLGTATKLTIGGSETAASAIARGGLLNTTLVASANNDALVGLEINPTFNPGAFSGVSQIQFRLRNLAASGFPLAVQIDNAGRLYLGEVANSYNIFDAGFAVTARNAANVPAIIVRSNVASNGLSSALQSWQNNTGTVLANLLNNGRFLLGTSTDGGFLLDVNGTARVSGAMKLFSGGTAPANSYPLNVYVSSGGFASFEYATTGFIQFVRAGASAGFIHSSYAENFDITLIPGNSFTTLGLCIRPDGVGVKIGGSTTITHVNSAQLNVESTTRGFLPPRMTTTEKGNIASPAAGLMVFDTTLAKLCVYSGTAWETITSI